MKEKIWQTIKNEKHSIIVLAVAAVVFLAAFFYIHSEDILKGGGKIFWVYGDELVEFEVATVTSIESEEMEVEETADGAYSGNQELAVTVKSGRYKGEDMVAYNYFGPYYGVPVAVGDSVTLTLKTHADGTRYATVYEVNRIPVLVVVLLLFIAIVVLVGGRTGLKSLAGLTFTIFCLFTILIPILFKGAPTVLSTVFICTYIAFVSFTILGGVHRKTMSAFLGTVSGMLIAMLLAIVVQRIAKIDGLRLEDAEPLLQLKLYSGATIKLRGLLTAGIIISSLGAVMDVAMSISSSIEEIHAANASLSRVELFRSGMNVGRDMVGTMTNTLILAFLGSEFTLIIFMYSRELTFYHLFSTAFVSLETISALSSSLGMVLAIPLTAMISSTLVSKKK